MQPQGKEHLAHQVNVQKKQRQDAAVVAVGHGKEAGQRKAVEHKPGLIRARHPGHDLFRQALGQPGAQRWGRAAATTSVSAVA